MSAKPSYVPIALTLAGLGVAIYFGRKQSAALAQLAAATTGAPSSVGSTPLVSGSFDAVGVWQPFDIATIAPVPDLNVLGGVDAVGRDPIAPLPSVVDDWIDDLSVGGEANVAV